MSKLKYLEGLRGLAALSVVLLHYLVAFYPAFYTGNPEHSNTRNNLEVLISTTPLNLIYAGNFGVCIFFVLSGYVLSYKFFKTKDTSVLTKSAIKRYPRLLVPVMTCIFISYLLMKVSLFFNMEASAYTNSDWWLGSFWQFEENFFDMVQQSFIGAFLDYQSNYNPVLWTMTYEFYGSLLIFSVAALIGKVNNRWVFYLLLILLFYKTYYLGFILGMVLSDYTVTIKNIKYTNHTLTKVLLLIVAIYLGSFPREAQIDLTGTIWNYINKAYFTDLPTFYHTIGAFLLLYVLIASERMKKLFSIRILENLGKISYSMYLIHLLILGTFSSYLYLKLQPYLSHSINFVITFLISIILIVLLSSAFYKYVDKSGIKLSEFIYNKYFCKRDK